MLAGRPDPSGRLVIKGSDFHHLVRVLRLRIGEELDGVDPCGGRHHLRLASVGKTSCVLEVVPGAAPDAATAPGAGCCTTAGGAAPQGERGLVLLQCLPKPGKMDLIVRQAVEAGTRRIVPLLSERTGRSAPGAGRLERWRRVAREAFQQSGAARFPVVDPPVSFVEGIRLFQSATVRIFFHEREAGSTPLHRLLAGSLDEVLVLVGPEGGLADREVTLLREAGFRQAWLGPTVLRTETAALYAVAAVSVVMRERETWKTGSG